MMATVVEAWPLVGREAELQAVDRLVRGDGRGVLFVGSAGLGKSRLVAEAIERAGKARNRWWVTHLHGGGGRSELPLGVFTPLLDGDTIDAPADVRAGAIAKALREHDGPVLLAIDDVHEIDEASAALLLREVAAGTCALVASARDNVPLPDAVHTMWKDEVALRVDVGPLADDDVVALLQAELGGPADDATRHAVIGRCAGNPLYLRELLRGCVESGALVHERDVWRLTGQLAPSRRLHELIGERIGALDDAQRAVLDLVVLGRPCELDWLDPDQAADAIGELERRQIIEIDATSHPTVVRCAHPLFHEVVEASLTTLDRRRIANTLSARVDSTSTAPPQLRSRVVLWRLDAGLPVDAEQLVEAARRARASDRIRLGLRYARAAHDLWPDPTSALLLGEMLEINGNFAEAERVLGGATPTNEWERARLGLARAVALFRGLGRHDEAEQIVDELVASLDLPQLHAEATALRVSFHVYRGQTAAAVAMARPLESELDGREFLAVTGPLSTALLRAGRLDDAADLAERATFLRSSLADEPHLAPPTVHFSVHLMSIAELGRLEEAATAVQASYDEALTEGLDESQRWLAGAAATINLTIGDVELAERFARETASRFDDVNHPAALWGMAIWAIARAYAGDSAGATHVISECDAYPVSATPFFTDMVVRARAWALAAQGELAPARQVLRELATSLHASGEHGTEHVALFDAARLGGPQSVLGDMEAIAPSLDGPLCALRLDAVRAMAAGDAAAMEAAAIAFEETGAWLYGAELANEAAIAFQAAGEPRRATFARRRAEDLARRCGGAATPGLAHGTESARLTRREREIARRAADGASSREIADALGVSHRTIETHLQNAYDKLGVGSRAELAELLDRDAL